MAANSPCAAVRHILLPLVSDLWKEVSQFDSPDRGSYHPTCREKLHSIDVVAFLRIVSCFSMPRLFGPILLREQPWVSIRALWRSSSCPEPSIVGPASSVVVHILVDMTQLEFSTLN